MRIGGTRHRKREKKIKVAKRKGRNMGKNQIITRLGCLHFLFLTKERRRGREVRERNRGRGKVEGGCIQ